MTRVTKRDRLLWCAGIAVLTALTAWTVVRVSTEPAPNASAAAIAPAAAPGGGAAAPGRVSPSQEPVSAVVLNKCPVSATACVDEGLRISWLQKDGKITYGPVPVMPGTDGPDDSVATPKGVFHVAWKDAHHVSNEFPEAMPNAVFFAPGGIAFHEGSLIAASHGCVHLSPEAAGRYFDALPVGAEVAVF
ncbi:L,D-transpeptidase [Amycolatopsis sp. NPDC058986]|uniref:L,D-transpeptidase n=1 Tax=unclassified Amycolatopsis TaxID=2618356 RepID=UPI00366D75CB